MSQHPCKVVPQSKGAGRSPWAGHSHDGNVSSVGQRFIVVRWVSLGGDSVEAFATFGLSRYCLIEKFLATSCR